MKDNRIFYNLTYPQKGIWQLEKLYPNTSIGNISATLKLETKLDMDAMDKAVNQMIKMNEALRIRISEEDGEPKQYIVPFSYQKIDFFDFSDRDIKEVYEWDTMMTKKPFYKTDSPLCYFAFVKITDTLLNFYVKLHHLIGDAWTAVAVGNELTKYYEQVVNHIPFDEIENPSYLAYIQSEQNYLNSDRFIQDQAYWMDKFTPAPELKTLKQKKTAEVTIKSKRRTFMLPEKLCKKIRQHCLENKTSIFSLYLGAMAIYFNRTRGDNEIVFGTPVLNRSNIKEKKTFGMFISTAPIKVFIDDNQDYNTFAETINKEWMTLLRHQKYPYTLMLENLRAKNPGFEKLYDIVISYQNAKFVKNESRYHQEGRWHLNGYQTDSLSIHINDREDDGDIVIDYDYLSDLFYEKEIDFLHKHVISLLWHSIDNPAKKLPFIEMISEEEKHRILYEFNQTEREYPKDKTVNELFEEQVKLNPDADCIIFENQKLSYDEFNKKSNQIARYLKEHGVVQGDILGIMLPRSLELMLWIMGIIKAGGAYLPLDPDFPTDRINVILDDSKSKYLITNSIQNIQRTINCAVLDIDKINLESFIHLNLTGTCQPNDLIYIIYTSGTTGVPKGVMIEHRSLINFIYGVKDILEFSSSDKVLSVTSVTFDIFVFENFTSWLNGSCIILSNDNQQKNPMNLKKLILGTTVDKVLTTPSRMQMLLNEESYPDFLKNVKVIMLGGEVLPINLYNKLKKLTQAKIVNGYGPTETTIGVSFKVLDDSVNIGKPLANTKIYILDKHMNLLPIGIPGEICIGGDCLARGYLNKIDITNEKFVQNPFDKNSKLYRSGDFARWYSKGDIEYISRSDSQVKIKGYRVELGEIEKEILDFGGIKNVVVVDLEDSQKNKFLCAYLICDEKISMHELREALKLKLPKYMVPSYFMKIDQIPLTVGGKTDRRSLPEPNVHLSLKTKSSPPKSKTEKLFFKAWQNILKIQDFGIDDDFFEMGGDSLAAIRLTSLVYKKKINVGIQDIYQYSTIRKLSQFIDENQSVTKQSEPIICYSNSSGPICIEPQPLDKLINDSKLRQIDSAAITYIPEDIAGLFKTYKEPILFNYIETASGRIGLFSIPISSKDLYSSKELLLTLCLKAVQKAQKLGAKAVSLTGLIPSATSYGHDLVDKLEKNSINIDITTGHATTASAVVLSINRLLESCNRDLSKEKVAIIGLGSVGIAVTRLLLATNPHPRSITLCDIYQKSDFLSQFKSELQNKFHFKNDIYIELSNEMNIPEKIYDATLIIGATNIPNILEVRKLKPGTLIIDDSGPHCFSTEDAIKRLKEKRDVLFTEGGVLESTQTINKRIYLPDEIKEKVLTSYFLHFSTRKEITGCILSSLLTTKYEDFKPVLGTASVEECIMRYKLLKELKYLGAIPHCDNYIIPEEYIVEFKSKFGQYNEAML
ncbi:MAG: amino acid adenylation domain-containing protein [Clostridia bacterium]|nr:amino acid adenylation domain-containing protein [Clostridia bacterium]